MKITYDPSATSGRQYSIEVDGQTFTNISQLDVLAVGRRLGIAHSRIRDMIAGARLASMAG